MNMALAVDMPDAPVTQDTVTAGSDGDDEDQGDDDQEDAPVTQDTINEGGESDGQGQPGAQLEGQEPESREVETEFSVSNEGNYASQCVPALQFGNTGNLNNQESSGSLPTVRSELQRFHT
jgi:hypothetical protein